VARLPEVNIGIRWARLFSLLPCFFLLTTCDGAVAHNGVSVTAQPSTLAAGLRSG
jgi:hypothetical protein